VSCRSVLHYATVCCSVLQCVAACCIMLKCVAVCCSVLQCVAVCRSVLQCAAVCCSVLQCVAVRCSVLQLECVCHSLASRVSLTGRRDSETETHQTRQSHCVSVSQRDQTVTVCVSREPRSVWHKTVRQTRDRCLARGSLCLARGRLETVRHSVSRYEPLPLAQTRDSQTLCVSCKCVSRVRQ